MQKPNKALHSNKFTLRSKFTAEYGVMHIGGFSGFSNLYRRNERHR